MQEERNESKKIRRWSVIQGCILNIVENEITEILIPILRLGATWLWKSYSNSVSFCFLTCKSGFIEVPTSKRTASKSAPCSERGRSKSSGIGINAETITSFQKYSQQNINNAGPRLHDQPPSLLDLPQCWGSLRSVQGWSKSPNFSYAFFHYHSCWLNKTHKYLIIKKKYLCPRVVRLKYAKTLIRSLTSSKRYHKCRWWWFLWLLFLIIVISTIALNKTGSQTLPHHRLESLVELFKHVYT